MYSNKFRRLHYEPITEANKWAKGFLCGCLRFNVNLTSTNGGLVLTSYFFSLHTCYNNWINFCHFKLAWSKYNEGFKQGITIFQRRNGLHNWIRNIEKNIEVSSFTPLVNDSAGGRANLLQNWAESGWLVLSGKTGQLCYECRLSGNSRVGHGLGSDRGTTVSNLAKRMRGQTQNGVVHPFPSLVPSPLSPTSSDDVVGLPPRIDGGTAGRNLVIEVLGLFRWKKKGSYLQQYR